MRVFVASFVAHARGVVYITELDSDTNPIEFLQLAEGQDFMIALELFENHAVFMMILPEQVLVLDRTLISMTLADIDQMVNSDEQLNSKNDGFTDFTAN